MILGLARDVCFPQVYIAGMVEKEKGTKGLIQI